MRKSGRQRRRWGWLTRIDGGRRCCSRRCRWCWRGGRRRLCLCCRRRSRRRRGVAAARYDCKGKRSHCEEGADDPEVMAHLGHVSLSGCGRLVEENPSHFEYRRTGASTPILGSRVLGVNREHSRPRPRRGICHLLTCISTDPTGAGREGVALAGPESL